MKSLVFLLVWMISAAGYAAETAPSRPTLLYSRYFNAPGENRYLRDGTFRDVLEAVQKQFALRVSAVPLRRETLRGINVVLIANPSLEAVGTNPPPHHMDAEDADALVAFVANGGGLVIMSNQENHNLEVEKMNTLLARFGLAFTNLYTDAKQLVLPEGRSILSGLRWAYYTGNLITLDPLHPAAPFAIVTNDLAQKPPKGLRDQPGVLLAGAQVGKGRVVVVTDSGWITNDALSGKGIGEVAIKEQDNLEIFQRLLAWVTHQPAPVDREKAFRTVK